MKKTLAVLLVALLVLAGCGSKSKAEGEFTVLNGAPLTGFFIDGYDNSSYDQDIVNLLNRSAVIYVDGQTGQINFNPTVLDGDPQIEELDGNKKYTFKIKSGLKYSDGQAITAKDYVFSVLFGAHPVHLAEATFESTGRDLVGYSSYSKGETDVFEGVELIDDNTFSLTIDKENLPYYYERISVAVGPSPMHVWFPEAEFNEAGNGFTNDVAAVETAEAKVQSLLANPGISSGPYVLESYENKIAVLKVNEHYAGDPEGTKPQIATVIVKDVEDDLLLEAIKKGEGDFAPNFIDGADIDEGLALGLTNVNYPRAAYGKIMFKTTAFPTDSKEVRQALGYVVDRNKFVEAITGGYGKLVDGPYGLAMAQFQNNKEEIESKIHQYTYNPNIANEILDTTDFVYESDGTTPFDVEKAGEGYYRHDSEGRMLEIKHYATVEAKVVSDLVGSTFPPGAAEAGIKYTMISGDWDTMMTLIKGTDYNGYNFASSFPSVVYDPYTSFHSDFAAPGSSNNPSIADDALDAAIEAIRRVEPGDVEAFEAAFVNYVVTWNDLLPELPLYSNQVYDFATDRVSGLDRLNPYTSWADSIEYISVTK